MYNVICSCCALTAQSPVTCNCTYPKLRTDHPVLVYKTYEFRWTVLRLFSCQSPHWSLSKLPHRQQLALQSTLSRLFSPFASSSSTSPCCSFGSVTFNSAPSLSLATHKVVSSQHFLSIVSSQKPCIDLKSMHTLSQSDKLHEKS